MARMFGTDGVRGVANKDLSCELALKIGKAGAYVLTSEVHQPRILLGRDTRLSGDMLSAALTAIRLYTKPLIPRMFCAARMAMWRAQRCSYPMGGI